MTKVTLSNLVNLQNETSTVTTINNNNAVITTAMDNTLSRDGTIPNTMSSSIDMNSNRIVNLPAPVGNSEPLRLTDLKTFIGGGTIQTIPAGGTTGQALIKNSNTNYDVGFGNTISSVGLALPTDFAISNSPVTTTGTLTGAWVTAPTGTGAVVRANTPTLVTPSLGNATAATLNGNTVNAGTGTLALGNNTLSISGSASSMVLAGTAGTYTFQGTDTYVGRATTDTLSNKTINNSNSNTIQLSGQTVSLGQYPGTTTNDSAAAGYIGQIIQSNVAAGSAITITNNVAINVTFITLTAGEWDVYAQGIFNPAATTSWSQLITSISTTTGALDVTTPFAFNDFTIATQVSGANGTAIFAGPVQFQVATTQTVFIVVRGLFTVAGMTAYGGIRARRIR